MGIPKVTAKEECHGQKLPPPSPGLTLLDLRAKGRRRINAVNKQGSFGRDVGSISREVSRNSGRQGYNPSLAQRLSEERRRAASSEPRKMHSGRWLSKGLVGQHSLQAKDETDN